MKTFRRFLLLLVATVLTTTVRAQVINGDLNHNDGLDVEDVTLLIDGYLTGEKETITTTVDPFMEDNSRIVGTWYKTKSDYVICNEDGTFGNSDMKGCIYKFLPFQGRILVFEPDGDMQDASVLYLTDEKMYLRLSSAPSSYTIYYRTAPPQPVTSIAIAQSASLIVGGMTTLTVNVYPADADNPGVTWASTDENVATVENGIVTAVAKGTATITCTTTDGSKLTASCKVKVIEPEVIDLGLSVKWANMNIGASSPEESGDYFAWGETHPKDTYSRENYRWYNSSSNALTQYNDSSSYGTVDHKTVLDLEDDAAHVNWRGAWRMPTEKECRELIDDCRWEWTTLHGIYGYKVTGSNGNSIFLPATGYRNGSSLYSAGYFGDYWSSSLRTNEPNYALILFFHSNMIIISSDGRYYGQPVRAVCP